jgi:uncharacterized protein
MKFLERLGETRPRLVLAASVLTALLLLLTAALPSIWPKTFAPLNGVEVDTDPENMLAADNPARVLHRESKNTFDLYDQVVVGIFREEHPDGVFNSETLSRVYALTEYASGLEGVIHPQILAPSTVDYIEQAGVGSVSFDWLMPHAPETQAEADQVRQRLLDLPMMKGTVIDAEGRALLLYIPIESKDQSYRVSTALLDKIAALDPPDGEAYHITGLPVANDTFGVQMFKQMAISAPTAMALIFVLMLLFFKRVSLVLSPMIVAMLSVIPTMALLVITGNTVHIMSSMIPIFIMPIAVLDGVHILSEFYDRYPTTRDRRKAIREVIEALWRPMLFTSLTTTAGFASLMLAPIPPVQVFGLFVAIGVMLAWLFTMTVIPAYVVLFLKDEKLQDFGLRSEKGGGDPHGVLAAVGRFTSRRARWILGASVLLLGFSVYGISSIQINDNPVKWFEADHRIRQADTIVNQHFAGSYPAYLRFDAEAEGSFKEPELLRYLADFQAHMEADPAVGKTISLNAIVKTVLRELLGGNEADFRVPDNRQAVAQTLLTYEGSHRPDDIFHFTTPDFSSGVVWFQLTSGDNTQMSRVVQRASDYLAQHPGPIELEAEWFGLTYINVVWQQQMVGGMGKALISSFIVVFLLMALLFRSVIWGLFCMVPLTLTISLIYGLIGLIGKDYDMPVAVLSSLSLGLAVDYAIHFLARSREIRTKYNSWPETVGPVFGEPARAISRNIIVIGVGFLPLILAPLMPYKTVGVLISSILLIAGAASLLVLPALLSTFARRVFKNEPSK